MMPAVDASALMRKVQTLRARLASLDRAIAGYDQAVRTGVWPDGRRPPEKVPGETRLGLVAMRDCMRETLRRLEEEATG